MSTRLRFQIPPTAAPMLVSVAARRFRMGLGLFAVILASACAPAVTPTPSAVQAATQILIPELPTSTAALQPTLVPTEAPVDATAVPTETVVAQPVATSRGPDLQATDPASVSLTSGGLQLVEFFRFT